ncbi:fibronectin type III domain-containing protein [Saccharospirillum alexandrii]|mgnify:CR=1 FL=1|uniref:fibronectin type III domain-containing protein n=1 Tax=Saccharospirillum alexandrii TaxID=2448477 RepID=UPI003736B2F4
MTARLLIICTTLLALYGCQIEPADFGSPDTTANNGSSNSGNAGSGDGDDSVARALTLYWSAPVERLNGEPMDFTDIGGYEIRYRAMNSGDYTNIVIDNPAVEQYSFDALTNVNDLVFEVAVFDANGIYSEFVVAQGS